MYNKTRKVLVILFIAFISLLIYTRVNAVTINETTNNNDGYDTIEEGTIIIGTTKFSPNTIITAVKAAIAGANDYKVYLAKGGDPTTYTAPDIYIYVLKNDWYKANEDGSTKAISPIASLELYYVDNEPKTGIDTVTGETITPPTIEKTTYTVKFLSDLTVIDTKEVEVGESVNLPANPTKEGYTFKGWLNEDGVYITSNNITPTGDTIIVADWTPLYYMVAFNSNGGNAIDSQSIAYGNTVAKPADPVKEGYSFDGWYLEEEEFDFNTEVKNNLTLTAKWSLEKYKVTFMNDTSVYGEIQLVEKGGLATRPAVDPTLEGNTFVDWYKDDEVFDFATPITEDTVITAKYKTIIYKILVGNLTHGSIITTPELSANYGDTVLLNITPDEGYLLVDNTLIVKDQDNNTIEVSPNNTFTMPASDVTITAEFERVYVITFNISEYGKVELTGDNLYKINDTTFKSRENNNIEFTITPDDGCVLMDGTFTVKTAHGDDILLNSDGKSFVMPDDDVVISAEFAKTKETIDAENDSLALSTVDSFMEDVENNNDKAILSFDYDTNKNSLVLVVNEVKMDNTLVCDYADALIDIVYYTVDGPEAMSYEIDGIIYNVDLSSSSISALVKEVAKLLCNLAGKAYSVEEASNLKLGDIAGKETTITANYKNNVVIEYTFRIESTKTAETIDEENDARLALSSQEYTNSIADVTQEGIIEINYDTDNNFITFVINEELQEVFSLYEYENTFSPLLQSIINDAESISYIIDDEEYSVNLASLSQYQIHKEVAKMLLRLVGADLTYEEAYNLKLADVVGEGITVDINYGHEAIITYTLAFESKNYYTEIDEQHDDEILTTIDSFNDPYDGMKNINYDTDNNKITFEINEDKQDQIDLYKYAIGNNSDLIKDLALSILEDSKTISYIVDGTQYNVDMQDKTSDFKRLIEFGIALLRFMHLDISNEVDEQIMSLKLGDLVGVLASMDITYSNGVVVEYTLEFKN